MLDFVSDQKPGWRKEAATVGEFPDYVEDLKETPSGLEPLAFAIPEQRLYPLHTKAATFLSAVHYAASGGQNSEVLERIKAAAELHGVADDIEPFVSHFCDAIKSASAAEQEGPFFALQVKEGDEVRQFYPLNDAHEVLKSAGDLLNDFDRGKLPGSWYADACRCIVKRADALGIPEVEYSDRIRCAGEKRTFDKAGAIAGMRVRIGRGDFDDEGVELQRSILKVAGVNVDHARTMADALCELDRKTRVKYSMAVPDPYVAFFSGGMRIEDEDIAKMAADHIAVGDVLVPHGEFSKKAKDFLVNAFPKSALAAVAETMPMPELDLEARTQKAREQLAEGHEISKEALQAIADRLDPDQRRQLMKVLLDTKDYPVPSTKI